MVGVLLSLVSRSVRRDLCMCMCRWLGLGLGLGCRHNYASNQETEAEGVREREEEWERGEPEAGEEFHMVRFFCSPRIVL